MTPLSHHICIIVLLTIALWTRTTVQGHIPNHLFGGSHSTVNHGQDSDEDSMEKAIVMMPKVELHAHLHGSIRKTTLVEFAAMTTSTAASANGTTDPSTASSAVKLTLEDYEHITADTPFALFPLIHKLITSIEQVKRILVEMMDDYRQQHTIYLEIRSTPRDISAHVNKEQYLECLVQTIGEYNRKYHEEIIVKLVVSVDRSKNVKQAVDIIHLAEQYAYYEVTDGTIQYREKVIVAIDFSGNPLGGRFPDFAEIFTLATKKGFNTTVHTAESRELSEASATEDTVDETSFILNYRPDRLGHMLYLRDKHFDMLKELQAQGQPPLIEICPSTAFTLMGLKSFADHPHIRKLASLRYPFSLATDDSGIFNTDLTSEIKHMTSAIEFNLSDLILIQATSLEYAFVSQAERAKLESIFHASITSLKEKFPNLLAKEDESEKMDMSSLYTM